jgi:hypothetical protein
MAYSSSAANKLRLWLPAPLTGFRRRSVPPPVLAVPKPAKVVLFYPGANSSKRLPRAVEVTGYIAIPRHNRRH